MSNSVLSAFYIGRAFAEALMGQAEQLATQALSQVGKFDAEQRENLRQFTEIVMDRAHQAEAAANGGVASEAAGSTSDEDLQATIDTLRAEIAQTRVALQQYRAS